MVDRDHVGELLGKVLEKLRAAGYECNVDLDELLLYLNAETPYPDIPLEDIIGNELLLAHEVVEVCELKRMGLKVTRDVIVKHHDKVYEAHLKAAEIEFKLAEMMGRKDHIKARLRDVEDWCEDPLLPSHLKPECLELLNKYKTYV